MALAHVHLRHHTPKSSRQGGTKAVQYLMREGAYKPDALREATDAERAVDYLQRTSRATNGRDDLRHHEVFNLPAWAKGDAATFFEASAAHEGANRRWATSLQCSLPRGLPYEDQVVLSRDFLQTIFPHRPMLLVLHEPLASDGKPNAHFHALLSERVADGIERSPEIMFRRPDAGGCRKAIFGEGDRQAPYRLREAWCATANLTLDALGEHDYMDPRSRQSRGLGRDTVQYVYDKDDPAKLDPQVIDQRTPESRLYEQQLAVEWWTTYKRTMGITPATERQEALRIIAREVREPGTRAKELASEQVFARKEPSEAKSISIEAHPFIGNVRSKIYHAPSDPSYHEVRQAQQVLFATRAEAEHAGYRSARNQHHAATNRATEITRLKRAIAKREQYGRKLDDAIKHNLAASSNPVVLRKLDHLLSVDLDKERESSYVPESPFHWQKEHDADLSR